MLNREVIVQLIAASRGDIETLETIQEAMDVFEQYHVAIISEQLFSMIYGAGVFESAEYRDRRAALDKSRTNYHNTVITYVKILNRMSEQAGLPPIYDGIVSEDRPYRRQVANAVFEFLAHVIEQRT